MLLKHFSDLLIVLLLSMVSRFHLSLTICSGLDDAPTGLERTDVLPEQVSHIIYLHIILHITSINIYRCICFNSEKIPFLKSVINRLQSSIPFLEMRLPLSVPFCHPLKHYSMLILHFFDGLNSVVRINFEKIFDPLTI
jgi:hypothetical protein